jgi:hypothetical protein
MVTDVLIPEAKYAAPFPTLCEKNHIQPDIAGLSAEVYTGALSGASPTRGNIAVIDKLADGFTTAAGARRARLALTFGLLTALAAGGPARADLATPEQKKACTPDVYRLCAGEIPNVRAITACLRRQKANLSEACRAVFEQ